ncbi:MAG: LacI family DNA-binding transcriptional regulator [Micrococcales bacterium]|nr:LacI family DNA-binding transcriptional regulator [Micrococcales bacterium]OJX67575.1 MAG: LacI family transcriptional regulator [Micrococcales bacterium 72-143]
MTHEAEAPPRAERRRSGPSMNDVARLAGVSGQTVSRVTNGSQSVLPETRRRVIDAMDALGYSPNSAARALRSGTFDTIGVIAHKLARTGESRTVEAVVEAARDRGHTVTLIDVDSPSTARLTEAATRLSRQAIDGLVIIRAEVREAARLTLPRDLPVVVSDSVFMGRLPAVSTDQEGGTRAVVEHLLELGHPTVHHIAGPSDSLPARVRRLAWEQNLRARGRTVPEVIQGDWTSESGYAAGARIAADPSVTAVFCANDEMAAGLLVALHERSVDVPGDVSVAGFDDVPLARFLWPPLTTVRQSFDVIGRRLVDTLMDQIRDGGTVSSYRQLVPADLIVRASTGAHRPRR